MTVSQTKGTGEIDSAIVEDLGGTKERSGQILAGEAFMHLLFMPLWGRFSDGFGHRRELPRRVLVDPVQCRELRGRVMDCLGCDCIGRIQSCHDSPLW